MATVKQQMKSHWPGPGTKPASASVYNLYWNPPQDLPLGAGGVWSGHLLCACVCSTAYEKKAAFLPDGSLCLRPSGPPFGRRYDL